MGWRFCRPSAPLAGGGAVDRRRSSIVRFMFVRLAWKPLTWRDLALFHEDDQIRALAIFRDKEPAPKRTGDRVLETLRPISHTLNRSHSIDPLNSSSESF